MMNSCLVIKLPESKSKTIQFIDLNEHCLKNDEAYFLAKKMYINREKITSSIYTKDECYVIINGEFNYKKFFKNKELLLKNSSTIYYREYLVKEKVYKVSYKIRAN